jgi:hypothetical protein
VCVCTWVKVEGCSEIYRVAVNTKLHTCTRIWFLYVCLNDTLVIGLNKKHLNVDTLFNFYNSHNIL